MGIRNNQPAAATEHELVASADKWTFESESTQATDQLRSRNRVHVSNSGNARSAQRLTVDFREVVAELEAGDDPVLQR